MRIAPLLGLATAVAAVSGTYPGAIAARHDTEDYYVLHLDAETPPEQVALRLGLSHQGRLGELADHHIFTGAKATHDVVKREVKESRRRKRQLGGRDILDGVRFSEKQALRAPWEKRIPPSTRPHPRQAPPQGADSAGVQRQSQVMQTLDIHDPIFREQWHLFNPVQIGHDVNVTDVWLQGITGKNATVAIVDDGLDMYSDDLKGNYYAAGSHDFNDKTDEPRPRLSDDKHGTRCAGEVSAVRNDVCGVGVAYDSKIAGLRILSKAITDADEAVAMNYDYQHNQIYSCSWGPPDDGKAMDAPGILIRRAMLNAVQNGRGGLGSIYVFASGNGAANEDNCNFDGYTNSIYSITVGAIDREGGHPYYSEKCSASLVVTYSSGAGDAIHTTDVGTNQCYSGHGGTSAAAPLAAGIFALVLQVRPDISWRDMQYLAMDTAVPINLDDADGWQTTTAGRKYSHTFAYGKVDSYGIVEAAKTWKNVKPQAWFFSPWIHVNQNIPQGDQGIAASFEVTKQMLQDANVERLEHVTVTMNVKHARRGDLSVDLISPDKIVSHIAAPRRNDDSNEGYDDWTFMSVVHWGESGVGTWTVVVKDTKENEFNGTWTDFHLKLWGEAIDPKKATMLPVPNEEDDNDHAVLSTTTAGATTTAVANPTNTGVGPIITPSDHPDRPVNEKPTPTKGAGLPTETDEQGSDKSPAETTKPPSSWLPGFLPTFGVSSTTQAWIYGSAALIVVFISGLGVYLYMARRRRLRNNGLGGDYEFELVDEEEGAEKGGNDASAGLLSGEKGRGRRTRGGELYDAFAGGSEDEEDEDGEFVDAEYRDRAVDERDDDETQVRGERQRRNEGAGVAAVGEGDHHVIGDDSDDEEEEERYALQPTP